ncbi:hypothetical protein ACKAV7_010815 [Fusarium commune]
MSHGSHTNIKLFLLGATGWVGSCAAYKIAAAHPDYEYVVLVRSEGKANDAKKFLPGHTRFVIGDFESFDLIASEAVASDIVLNWASSDHDGLNNAVLAGLKRKGSQCYLIHTSGTGLLTYEDIKNNRESRESSKVYDDWEGVGEVVGLPDDALHMNVDRAILRAASETPYLQAAIVCPPLIYGVSCNEHVTRERSAARQYVVDILKRGKGFFIKDGKARWNTVHINDLAQLFLLLVENAAQGGGNATWGPEAYYFAENGDVCFGEFATEVSRVAFEKGYISTLEMDRLTVEEGKQAAAFTTMMTLYNARSKAVRARKLLNWEPVNVNIIEDITQNWRFIPGDENPFI